MIDENMVLAPESSVTAIYGGEKNPQLTPLEIFLRSEEAMLFKQKYGGETPEKCEKWLQRWLTSPHVVFVCSPQKALEGGRYEYVISFVKRTLG
jgi:hypothetical protein